MPVEITDTKVTLTHPNGASVTALLYGATVISWKSPSEGRDDAPPKERLFVSSKAALDGSKPVRGGIPVVFPFFGPATRPEHSKMGQHGFARSSQWHYVATVLDSDAGVSVQLGLKPTPEIDALYAFPWALTYTITLAAHQLTTDIAVKNTGGASFDFQALLHTYIAAHSASVSVSPLTGLTYIDKVAGGGERTESRELVDVRSFTDSVYKGAGGRYSVRWEGGGVDVRANGFGDVVVWNPNKEAGWKIGDMEDGGWDKFVCVEPGTASYWVTLGAGEEWKGQQVISAL
ncbi:galactose mutarotase-like protein [Exidia glandulosa HHB12029]|uniref:Glucose-6-phosphate 1-epimerase n=1 Tax=Exidia glandulosa HHB12029 TaxID=1314781 RepID=A0A165PH10_EXIGL|nr:galactose mutarotase-like protein [Exidia glandulosa HHB12029]